MKSTTINQFNVTMILMFFLLGFCVAPTFANTGLTHCNADTIFGHSEVSEGIEEHDSEWPTEEQPEAYKGGHASPVVTMDHDEHHSEWPTEEHPTVIN